MAEARLLKSAGQVQWVAAAALASGEIVTVPDGRMGVVAQLAAVAANDPVSAFVEGRFAVACAAATTFSVGQPVIWDVSASLAINAPGATGDKYLGRCIRASTSADATVDTELNAGPTQAAQRGLFVTAPIVLDHADAAAVEVISAEDNVDGMAIIGVFGEVTEAPAGSTEDQLVITFQDEDDNALSTLTTTDTTPDAIGDGIVGTQDVIGLATGGVLSTLPAGKAGEFIVSQATAGTPAGKIRCYAILAPLL